MHHLRCASTPATVMDKTGRTRGLISYTTLRDYNTHAAEAASAGRAQATAHQRSVGVSHIVRPRTLLYFGLWSLVGVVMLVGLLTRDRLDINVLPDRNPLYVTLSDGSIRNGYTIKILNMTTEPRTFEVAIDGLPARRCGSRETTTTAPAPSPSTSMPTACARSRSSWRSRRRRCARPDRLRLHRSRSRRLGSGRAAAEFYAPGG
jgi:polyferredoxin